MSRAKTAQDPAPPYDEAWFASRAQPGVRGLRAYDPGLDLVDLRRQFGADVLVELGSNENPYGASPVARAAVLDQLLVMHRYPDPRGSGLKRALADHHGVDVDTILLGNGSHELLMQLAQVFAGADDDVLFSRYGFAVFALAGQAAGANLRVVDALPRTAIMPLGHDLEAMVTAITPATRLVYLANPNNPTGTWFGFEAFSAFMARVPAGVIVVLDEAYAEMADAGDVGSAIALLATHPNLVVTRTFSKAYGLAGLRIGYLLAAPGLVAVMERVRESFNVNGLALAAAQAALGDDAHLQSVCVRNAEQRVVLTSQLRSRGLEVLPSQTNFVLVRFGPQTAEVEAGLVARGVVPRPMAGYGLPDFLRITIGTADENRELLEALDAVLA